MAVAQWLPVSTPENGSITRTGQVFVGWSTVPSWSYLSSSTEGASQILSSDKSIFFANSLGYVSIKGTYTNFNSASISHSIFNQGNAQIAGYSYVYNGTPTYKGSLQFSGGATEITMASPASTAAAALRVKAGDLTTGTGGALVLNGGNGTSGGNVTIQAGTHSGGTAGLIHLSSPVNLTGNLFANSATAGTAGSVLMIDVATGLPKWKPLPEPLVTLLEVAPGYIPRSNFDGTAFENSLLFDNGSGRLGIGLTDPVTHPPVEQVQVGDYMTIHADGGSNFLGYNARAINTGGVWSRTRLPFAPGSIGMSYIAQGSDGGVQINTAGAGATCDETPDLVVSPDGKVGIGTGSPIEELDVNGTLRATGLQLYNTGYINHVLTINHTGSSSWIPKSDSLATIGAAENYIPKFNATGHLVNSQITEDPTNGRVGIGTATPTHTLDVAGAIEADNILLNGLTAKGVVMVGTDGQLVNSVITQDGSHVGIGLGTATPAHTLEVGGAIQADNILLNGLTTNGLVSVGADGQLVNASNQQILTALGGVGITQITGTPGNLAKFNSTGEPGDAIMIEDAFGNVRIGGAPRGGTPDGAMGSRLFFNGGSPVASSQGYDNENSDPLFMQRVNEAADKTSLRINLGDDGGVLNDKAEFGFYKYDGSGWVPGAAIYANGEMRVGGFPPNVATTVSTGAKLHLEGAPSFDANHASNQDEIYLQRVNLSLNRSGLRLNLGDDVPDQTNSLQDQLSDKFSVGNYNSSGNWVEGVGIFANGSLFARRVKVTLDAFPDYVFAANYKLPSLKETEDFINRNGHLPEVPCAEEVAEKGADLGEMNKILLKKIEEMTLHLIRLEKEVEALKTGK